ncbi:MAG: DNA repair protein RecO [Akkermansiaceae bacterium]|nr:DNA repair protein RecO [Akkermansiaceae bacterium]
MIRLTRLTETSLIVHWFTEAHGLVKTVAKGARRPKSSFAGQLDLFFSGEISFSQAQRGELHSLREVAIQNWREGLRKNYTSTLLASYCCQLLESAVESEHPDPELYDLLNRALDHFEAKQPSLRSLYHFENQLAIFLGVSLGRSQAAESLRDAIGVLPSQRDDLIKRLSIDDHFSSSN